MAVALSCVAFGLMSYIGQRAAHKMHDDLLDGLLLAPMKFFDSTPLGRLVNLFSKDLYTIDEELPVSVSGKLRVALLILFAGHTRNVDDRRNHCSHDVDHHRVRYTMVFGSLRPPRSSILRHYGVLHSYGTRTKKVRCDLSITSVFVIC